MGTEIKDSVNKTFVSPSERSDEIFKYLNKVRKADRDQEDYSPEELNKKGKGRDLLADNTYSRNFVDRLPYISSDSRAFSPTAGASIDYTGHIMPGNRLNKKIASGDEKDSLIRRIGKTSWADINKFIGKYTVNPAVQSLMYGGLAGLGMYAAAPALNRYLSALSGDSPTVNRYTGEVEWISPEERRSAALWTGLGIGGLNLLRHINLKNPSWSDLWHFHKNNSAIEKKASMLGPVDYVPKSFAMNAVTMDPKIPDSLKYTTLNVLGNISGGDDTMINSTDMVMAGINSGLSGKTGLPLGRVAAAATADALMAYGIGSFLGVKSPGKLARNIGLGSAALRTVGSLL